MRWNELMERVLVRVTGWKNTKIIFGLYWIIMDDLAVFGSLISYHCLDRLGSRRSRLVPQSVPKHFIH